MNNQYGRVDYWEDRYSRDQEPFDWLQRYSGLREIINKVANSESKVLSVGAGTSILSEEMFEEGITHITDIDTSEMATQIMQEKYEENERTTMQYLKMDAMAMTFEDATYDLVIDKATFDTVICQEDSTKNQEKFLGEMSRVLKEQGTYLMVSAGQPDSRLELLQQAKYGWTVSVEQVNKPTITQITIQADEKEAPTVHFVYVCQKGEKKYETQEEGQDSEAQS